MPTTPFPYARPTEPLRRGRRSRSALAATVAAFAMALSLAAPATAATGGAPSDDSASTAASVTADGSRAVHGRGTGPATGTGGTGMGATSAPHAPDGVVGVRDGLPGQDASAPDTSSGSAPTVSATGPIAVDPAVRTALTDADTVSVVIRLREQLDLDAAGAAADAEAAAAAVLARRTGSTPAAVADAADAARATSVVTALQATGTDGHGRVADLLGAQAAAGHASAVQSFWIFNGFAATVDEAGLNNLAASDDIASIEVDHTVDLPQEPAAVTEPKLPTWGLENINAPDVWGTYGDRGAGVVVGIMDSGADYTHPALAESWRGADGDVTHSWFAATGEAYPMPDDGFGHGTHVTGTIVGAPPGDVIGVAPGAQWIAAKIFRDSGSSSDSIIHAGFQWMLAPGGDPAMAPDVVNNSWGSAATYDTEFWADVDAWRAAGIVPMFAGGNDGPAPQTIGSPGSFPQSITVGATDINDLIASFSSRGPVTWDGTEYVKPMISAPGVDVYSSWPSQLGGGYQLLSGTSMATPHATGVVALLLAANPTLSIDDITEILEETTRTAPTMGALPNDNYGYGIIDAYAAVTRAAYSGEVTGTVSGPEGPIAGASVTIDDSGVSATTRDDGSYELWVPQGDHELTAAAYGYTPQTRAVSITAGSAYDESFTLEAAPVRVVAVTVTSTDGPVAGARVTVTPTPVGAAYTDADGHASLEIAEGAYTLRVAAAGYVPASQPLVVDGDKSVDVSLSAITTPAADGWRQFQNNPPRTGYTTDALAPATLTPNWTADLPSNVTFSSPVVGDGVIYLGTDDGNLRAISAADGSVLWSHDAGSYRRGAPAVVDGVVYSGGGVDGSFYALDAATGDVRWTVPTPGRLTVYASPVVLDGVVYEATGPDPDATDAVYAIDAASGEVLWTTPIGTNVYMGPAVADGMVVIGTGDSGELMGLDAATGEVVWTLDRATDSFISTPSIADFDGTTTVYIATTGDDGSSGSLLAVNAATGELIWEQSGNGDGQGGTSTIYGDLVITSSHTLGFVSAYDRASGDLVWRYSVPGAVSAGVLATTDGFVVGGSQLDNRFFALDATTGELVWDDAASANVTTAPAYADGMLVTVDGFGVMHAYHPVSTVTGTITGPGGSALAATVRIAETGTSVETDPVSGEYTLTEAPGAYTLEIRAYGYEQVTEAVDMDAGATLVRDAQLAAVGDGSLAGTVRDGDGAPISGAAITVLDTPLAAQTTGADGAFAFDPVAAGTYTVRIEAPGYETYEGPSAITEGTETTLDVQLLAYQIAVTGDYDGRILAQLTALGYRAEASTYADVTAHPEAYQAVVANGAEDDPGEDAFRAFLDATDAAGTSVVFLDQWSLGYGATNLLLKYLGDPAELPSGYSDSGRVTVRSLVDHPLTAGLPLGEATDLIIRGNEWSAYAGWSGTTVAQLATDATGVAGGAIGYQPRGYGSAHILLSSLAAAASWGIPDEHWLPAAHIAFANAVAYALDADYGGVSGTVTNTDGQPLAGVTVTDVGGADVTTTAADGTYSLLLPPGDHTLRFELVGSTPVEQPVTIESGTTVAVDATLDPAGSGAVAGVVTSGRDGSPIAGATVDAVEAGASTTTGDDGSYTLPLPAGTYTLTVSADGHLSSSQPIEVTAGATTTVDVTLEPAPVVGVLGDYASDSVVAFLGAHEITAEDIAWTDIDRVGEFDVIVFNDPSDPGLDTFNAWMTALDEAQVSSIWGDDWLGAAIDGILVKYRHDPEATDWESADGTVSYHPLVDDSPLFEGIDGDALMFSDTSTYTSWFTGYSGIPIADSVGEVEGDLGLSVAYAPRTPGSIELLLGGLAVTSIGHSPNDGWAEDAPQFYLNAIRWAAAPGLGSVQGNVTNAAGDAIAATVSVDGTSFSVDTDPVTGAYVVPLAPGDYTLHVEAFGYAPQDLPATVTANTVTRLDITMATQNVGSISGVVTALAGVSPPGSDAGSHPGAGDPVVGATVTLLGTPLSTTTDDLGAYELDLVSAGTYELEIAADGYVRTRVDVTVEADETTTADVAIRPSPHVGVLDEDASYPYAIGYLTYWGYDAVEIDWTDTALIGDLDLILANLASYPNHDPGAAGFAAFDDALNRAGTPVIWLDQYGRGSFQWLEKYAGDPAAHGSDRSNDNVIVTATDPDSPLLAGLPDEFELVAPDAEYSWYGDFSGTTVATVTSSLDPAAGGNEAGFRARGAGAVDVLLGGLSISTYGWPAYGDVAGDSWTPAAERLLRNALGFALDTDGLGADARGKVVDADAQPLGATVTVVETGKTYAARASDGSFAIPLDAGSWTLRAEMFGYLPSEVAVTVAAGDVITPTITLEREEIGTVTGRVTGPSGAIAGATVSLVGGPLSTQTLADGSYTIAGIPAGPWTLHVDAAGYMDGSRSVDVPSGGTVTADITLEASRPVAVVEDSSQDSIQHLLEGAGYTVTPYEDTQLATLLAQITDYRLVIFNNGVTSTHLEEFTTVTDAAAANSISVIYAAQWGGGSLKNLVDTRADPASVDYDFVEDTTIEYTPQVESPIFAGFPLGEPITLMGNATENQQWVVYGDYTGTTLAALTTDDVENGPVIGNGVGYAYTSATSVEILLASLGAGSYGRPDEPEGAAGRWTPDAVQVYLNAVDWASASEQGSVSGTVLGDGAPLDGATITAVELGSTTRTAADGTYELALPDGTWTIRAEAFGYEPQEQPVTITDAGSAIADFDLDASPRGSITGTVTSKGKPVAGATVTGTGPESFETTTTADGTYDSGPLLPGDYALEVVADGYVSNSAVATVAAGDPTVVDITLKRIKVAVLGDWHGALTGFLQNRGRGAEEIAWSDEIDLSPYRVVVVNGGSPDADEFAAMLAEAQQQKVSLVYTGTWGVDQGGIRLLERYTDRVTVGEQGYGDGRVGLTGFDGDLRLFRGITKDPAKLIRKGGYYSMLDSYAGTPAGDLTVRRPGDDPRGLGVGYEKLSKKRLEIVLSASAVTGTVGPDLGWAPANKKLIRNAILWAMHPNKS